MVALHQLQVMVARLREVIAIHHMVVLHLWDRGPVLEEHRQGMEPHPATERRLGMGLLPATAPLRAMARHQATEGHLPDTELQQDTELPWGMALLQGMEPLQPLQAHLQEACRQAGRLRRIHQAKITSSTEQLVNLDGIRLQRPFNQQPLLRLHQQPCLQVPLRRYYRMDGSRQPTRRVGSLTTSTVPQVRVAGRLPKLDRSELDAAPVCGNAVFTQLFPIYVCCLSSPHC